MSRFALSVLLSALLSWPAAGVAQTTAAAPEPASAALQAEVDAWRAHRFASLTGENGWLSLVALLPLHSGANSLGSAAGSTLRLDRPDVPAHAARISVSGGKVMLKAARGSGITLDGKPVTQLQMQTDASGSPTVLALGTLRFFVIDRLGHLFLRVRDVQNPKRNAFRGVETFPVSDAWSINARFEPYVPAHQVTIMNVLGLEQQIPSPGAVVFEKDGRSWRLDTLDEDPSSDALTLMFADATSGRETYGAGRFLEVPRPSNGSVQVNFNRAYNPPCAFSSFATCPLPPPQNKIALRVEAGEKRYEH